MLCTKIHVVYHVTYGPSYIGQKREVLTPFYEDVLPLQIKKPKSAQYENKKAKTS